MAKDNVIDLKKPESFIDDPIKDILRQGARRLLSAALEAEVETFLKQYKDISDGKGWQRVVRNGYLPEREIQTGIGQVQVKAPRIHDRQTYVATIGSAVSLIPTPYTVAAGVALQIIGGLIGLASWLDDDDHYGDGYKTWLSQESLEGGVGSYVLSYYEVDTSWYDDGHDFDLTLNLISA